MIQNGSKNLEVLKFHSENMFGLSMKTVRKKSYHPQIIANLMVARSNIRFMQFLNPLKK